MIALGLILFHFQNNNPKPTPNRDKMDFWSKNTTANSSYALLILGTHCCEYMCFYHTDNLDVKMTRFSHFFVVEVETGLDILHENTTEEWGAAVSDWRLQLPPLELVKAQGVHLNEKNEGNSRFIKRSTRSAKCKYPPPLVYAPRGYAGRRLMPLAGPPKLDRCLGKGPDEACIPVLQARGFGSG